MKKQLEQFKQRVREAYDAEGDRPFDMKAMLANHPILQLTHPRMYAIQREIHQLPAGSPARISYGNAYMFTLQDRALEKDNTMSAEEKRDAREALREIRDRAMAGAYST